MKSKKNYLYISTTIGLLLLGLSLRVYGSERMLGGGDEAEALLGFIYHSPGQIIREYFAASNHILHSLTTHFMVSWFGEENELAIRFPSVILGFADLILIYKTASIIFPKSKVPLWSLGIIVLNPTHIYYSQTARGYGMLMFLSTAATLTLLKALTSKHKTLYLIIFSICSFLSIYTIPTNIYFIFGLAGWLMSLFLFPKEQNQLFLIRNSRWQHLALFAKTFAIILLLSYLAYLPVMDQIKEVARERINFFQLQHDNSTGNFGLALSLASEILSLFFKSSLIVFLPFLLIGIIWGQTAQKSYRLIPICLFFLPLLPVLAAGIGGYPRNYLFNFSSLTIFLAGGIVEASRMASSHLSKVGNSIKYALPVVFFLVSANILIYQYYPSIKTPKGEWYTQNLTAATKPHDLLLFKSTKDYLYARSVFSKNLQNIFEQNQLHAVHVIAKNLDDVQSYQISNSFTIFKDLFQTLASNTISSERNLFSITTGSSRTLLSEDFELKTFWKLIGGNGIVEAHSKEKLEGDASLLIQTSSGIVISARIAENLSFDRHYLVLLLWSGKSLLSNKNKMILPAIYLNPLEEGLHGKIKLGSINPGNRVRLRDWPLLSFVGVIPPGKYNIDIHLAAGPNQKVLFDGLRLFVMEISSFAKKINL